MSTRNQPLEMSRHHTHLNARSLGRRAPRRLRARWMTDAHAVDRAGRQQSEFYPGHRMRKLHDVHDPRYALPKPEPSTSLDRGYGLCLPLCVAPSRGLLRHRAQVEHRPSRLFGAELDRSSWLDLIFATRPFLSLDRLGATRGITPVTSAAMDYHMTSSTAPSPARSLRSHHQQLAREPGRHGRSCALVQKPSDAAVGTRFFEKWITQHLRSKPVYGTSDRTRTKTHDLEVSVYVLVAIVNRTLPNLDASSTLC